MVEFTHDELHDLWIYMNLYGLNKANFFLRFQVAKESFLTILSERVFPFSP